MLFPTACECQLGLDLPKVSGSSGWQQAGAILVRVSPTIPARAGG